MNIKEIFLSPVLYSYQLSSLYIRLRDYYHDLDFPDLRVSIQNSGVDLIIGCRYIGKYLIKILSIIGSSTRKNGKILFNKNIFNKLFLEKIVEDKNLDWNLYPKKGRRTNQDKSVSLFNIQNGLKSIETKIIDIPDNINKSIRKKLLITIRKLKILSKILTLLNYRDFLTKDEYDLLVN